MIIYSVVSPFFDSEFVPAESVTKTENGITSFYEKDLQGELVLKFSTDPKKYLKTEYALQYFTKR